MLNLITDRSQADVDRLNYLHKQIVNQTATTDELQEYMSPSKGAYNASDIKRVIDAMDYLKNLLNKNGYAVDNYKSISNAWNESSIVDYYVMEDYLHNVSVLKRAFDVRYQIPTNMDRIDYEGANKIEEVLLMIEDKIIRMQKAWLYSGEIFSGEM